MKCSALAAKIESIYPNADPLEVARMTALICSSVKDRSRLNDRQAFLDAWQEATIRIQAATDQHAAVAAEMSELAGFDPRSITTDQAWILIRAIKVQTQLLKCYVGNEVQNQKSA